EGRREPVRVTVPKGEYRAFFYETDPNELRAAADEPTPLERFWAPYFASGYRNLLVHGSLGDDAMPITQAYAIARLAILFDKHRVAIEMYPSSAIQVLDLKDTNLILIGSRATNAVLAEFMEADPERASVSRIGAADGKGAVTIIVAPKLVDLIDAVGYICEESTIEKSARRFCGGAFPTDFALTLG